MVKTLEDLQAKRDGLDPADPKSANTIVIISYDTMRLQMCQEGYQDGCIKYTNLSV